MELYQWTGKKKTDEQYARNLQLQVILLLARHFFFHELN